MTTKRSPRHVLERQAVQIAATLERAARGGLDHLPKVREARERGSFEVGVVMDDKVIKLSIPWSVIRDTPFKAMVEYIVKNMQETIGNG